MEDLTRPKWRSWLKRNHASQSEAWIVFYKTHTGLGKIWYLEALDEALCFGWIDGRVRRIDNQKHMVRFTPRRRESFWSNRNVKNVRRLIEEGRMTPAGLTKIDSSTLNKPISKSGRSSPRFRISPEMRKRLSANQRAWRNYLSLPPSTREMYAYWLSSAKKPETKKRRLRKAIALLSKNKSTGILY